ncbi:peptidase M20 [Photobacterium proteolyticum]|uniref:Peptidase M20 n=1 Tax=Photobacterium proteolyticum TaxID=1903952 RepID=A0A1Q9G5R1_9GAMM|nr:M20 aminoacylase family protein [Photobacterium proteolyticum]OLQ69309.1 peptidase M20 [Photobacterium proteolyticum]
MIEAIKNNNQMFSEWRRHFHMNPEISYQEHETAKMVAEMLKSFGFDEVHTGIGGTGLVGVLKGKYESDKAVGLRADMDALAMNELNEFEHASKSKGVMHACGHDGHMATLLAAAWYLAQEREFSGTVNFIFQTAEEELTGSKTMIDDGLFERFPCDRIYGLHNMPHVPEGHIWLREGAIEASCDRFDIEIVGKGGHAAMPEGMIDAPLVMSNLIMAAHSIVSRNVSPLESVVLSFADAHAGSGTYNIMPKTATLKGCVRAFDEDIRQFTLKRLREVVEMTAKAHGATAVLTIREGSCPATVNNPEQAKLVAKIAAEIVGEDKVDADCRPLSGSEDFSWMLQEVEGCYMFIGNEGAPLHNPSYDFNDSIIPVGASLFVKLVEHNLPA